jgi:hypothetical protein
VCKAKSDYRILWVQLSGVKWGCGPRKGVEVETVSGGLILPEEWEIEEIPVELYLEQQQIAKSKVKATFVYI